MRIFMTIGVAALMASGSVAAQVQQAETNTAHAAGKEAKSKKAAKGDQEVICKRTGAGKVCMTAKKWKDYEEIM